MNENPTIILKTDGTVHDANDAAAGICGISRDVLIGNQLVSRLLSEHRARFESEIAALSAGEEHYGIVNCTIIGLDAINRRLSMGMTMVEKDLVYIQVQPFRYDDSLAEKGNFDLMEPGRFLAVAQRITTLSRKSQRKKVLLKRGVEILCEVTHARWGTALKWGDYSSVKLTATVGDVDNCCLPGIFRPSIITRLIRGEVIVKESCIEGCHPVSSIIVIPLLYASSPQGVIVLSVDGFSMLTPEEQQGLSILGETMGLGLGAISASSLLNHFETANSGEYKGYRILERLSRSISHEINNSTTILRNNIHEMSAAAREPGGIVSRTDSVFLDSLSAIDTINNLSNVLSAFAPDQKDEFEIVSVGKTLDMVVSSLRFYLKRGISITIDIPEEPLSEVFIKSHHLIRSMFLIFAELLEIASRTTREILVNFMLDDADSRVNLTVNISGDATRLPQNFLVQLEKGGDLTRHIVQCGAEISHLLTENGEIKIFIALPKKKQSTKTDKSQKSNSPTRRGTILIVDDEIAVIRSLRRVLEKDNDVLAVRDGMDAVKILRSNENIDVVLYDISVPGLTGPHFLDELKRLSLPIADRVIFLSGGSHEAEISNFFLENEDIIIDKPVNLSVLSDMIAPRII